MFALITMPFFSHADDWDETESCRVKLKDSFAIEAKYCDDCDTDDIKFYVRGKKDNTIELKEDVIYLKKEGNVNGNGNGNGNGKSVLYSLWSANDDVDGIFNEDEDHLDGDTVYTIRIEFNDIEKSRNSYTVNLSYFLYDGTTLLKPGIESRVEFDDLSNSSDVFFEQDEDLFDLKCRLSSRPEPIPTPICSVFTSPLQTWVERDEQGNIISGNGNLSIQNASVEIIGTNTNSFGERLVGFEQNHILVANPQTMKACDGQACVGDIGMRQPKEALSAFLGGAESLNLAGYTGYIQSKELSGSALYKSVNIQEGGTLILKNGTYWFESISMNGKSAIVVPEGEEVVIHTKKLYMTNTSFIGTVSEDVMQSNTSKKPEIYRSSSLEVVKNGGWFVDGSYLRINVHEDSQLNGSKPFYMDNWAVFIGMVYNESNTYLTSNTKFYGALTSKNVYLDNNAKIIRSSGCLTPVNSFGLELTPSKQLALMCGDDIPTFDILTKNDLVGESSQVEVSIPNSGGVAFTLDALVGSGNTCSITNGGDTCTFTSNSNGELTIAAKADNSDASFAQASYQFQATLVQDTEKSETVVFSFVPYKFDIKSSSDDEWNNSVIPVIANKSADIDIRVLACPTSSDTSSPVVLKYNSTLNDENVSWDITMPSQKANGVISLTELRFTNGLANSSVTFTDSGEANITLRDATFDCDNFNELKDPDTNKCQIEGGILTGEFTVKSRPWKFSVCPQNSEGEDVSADGDSNGGSAFVAAGEPFSVRVTPIKYNSLECNEQEQVTQNYFLSEASAKLSYSLDSPSNGKLGILNGKRAREVTENVQKNTGYMFSDLTYTEVGSIGLSVLETGSFYSSIEVDGAKGVSGKRIIGRFYPEHFKITKTTWDYPDTQEDASYIYMEQKFDLVQFDVSAFSSKGELTQNYGLFSNAYKVNFELSGDYAERLNIDDESEFNKSDWSGAVWSKSWSNSIEWSKLALPDGPFNSGIGEKPTVTKIGLSIRQEKNELKDPSQFKYIQKVDGETEKTTTSNTQSLLSQPDVRYGRINLDDVGGRAGSRLTVPLRVEYWNGIRFVRHADDGGTIIEAELEKQTVIWPGNEVGCDVIVEVVDDDVTKPEGYNTISDAQVNQGTLPNDLNERLLAHQDCSNPPRQQSQVWLDLDANGLPWLQYNWRGKGEENPSSVVTFGIHRGNDRVIYRGEPGLTAQ
jgi:MSHA biogenesis protein MshQ